MLFRVVADGVAPPHLGEHLVQEEGRVTVTERVVLERPVAREPRILRDEPSDMAGVGEEPDGGGHLVAPDQVVEDDRHTVLASAVHVLMTVLEGRQRRGRAVVLSRDVDPVLADRARKDRALPDLRPLDAT